MRYILSIDGGGVRGIVPALALAELEYATGQKTRDIFSFVGGTSTGALLAAGIAAGLPAEQLVNIYRKRSREIFRPWKPWNTILQIARGYKYQLSNLRTVIQEEFGAAAGWTLNDSPIDILLTTKRLADSKPWYFVKDNPNNARTTGHLGLVDCAVASAAAPTYFNPYVMGSPVNGKLVDGGVGVTGNPVYQACVEAFCYSERYRPDDTIVVSLGTGYTRRHADPQWIWAWLHWVLDTLLQAPERQQTQLVARHYQAAKLYRIDPRLAEDIDMDDIDRISELDAEGQRFAKQIDWAAILRGDPGPFREKPPVCPGAS